MNYSLRDIFPETKFVKEFSMEKQLEVIIGEVDEAKQSLLAGNQHDFKLEIVDVMHSAAQLFYMLDMSNSQIDYVLKEVIAKNKARNYYGGITNDIDI